MSEACETNPLTLLVALADRLRARFEAAADEVGLTPAQAQVLVRIDAPRRLSELAHQQACDPSSITTMVQRLEREGLLKRSVDPADARARLVQPTAKGRRLRDRFLELVGDGSAIIDALPDEQRAALAGLFAARPVGSTV
jgi:DNA-binding MarR family transcriptional regulator